VRSRGENWTIWFSVAPNGGRCQAREAGSGRWWRGGCRRSGGTARS